MVAAVESDGGTFRAGKPEPVFKGPFRGGTSGLALAGNNFADYDVTADAQRFVMFPAEDESGAGQHPHVTFVTHWFDDLARTFANKRN